MTSTLPEVKISQNLPSETLGRVRIGFTVSLGEVGFRRFLSQMPPGQAAQYEERARPEVEVVLPGECADMFNLEDPVDALQQMSAISRHHRLNTTSYVLDKVLYAVDAA